MSSILAVLLDLWTAVCLCRSACMQLNVRSVLRTCCGLCCASVGADAGAHSIEDWVILHAI